MCGWAVVSGGHAAQHRDVKGSLAPRVVAIASLALVVACSPGSSSTPRPISTPTLTNATIHSDAASITLRLADLPAGYHLADDERITTETLSGGDDRGIVRDQAMRGGFVDGQQRSFILDADMPGADRAAYVYVFVVKDPAAASDALEKAVPKDPAFGRIAIGETIGDNSHGYRVARPSSDGSTLEMLVVEFQYGNALSYVMLQGPQGAPSLKEASTLAKKQLALLQADAVGPALSTPAPRTKPVPAVYSDLGLQLLDLPNGFKQTDDEAVTADDLSGGDVGAAFFKDIGFRGGWGRIFESADQATTVTSVVMLCSPAKSEHALAEIVKNAKDPNIYEISGGATVGDESFAVEAHGGGTAPMTYRSIYFRVADAVGWIIVRSPTGIYEAPFVTDLAKRLIAHIN